VKGRLERLVSGGERVAIGVLRESGISDEEVKEWRDLIQGIGDVIVRLRLSGELEAPSGALARLGIDGDEAAGLNLFGFVDVADSVRVRREVERAAEIGAGSVRFRLVNAKDYSGRVVELWLRRRINDTPALVGVLRLVSEQEGGHALVSQAERHFRSYLESTTDIFFAMDTDGLMTFISPQVDRYGFKSDQLLGVEYLSRIHADDRERVDEDFLLAFQGKQSRERQPFRIVGLDGKVYWFDYTIELAHDDRGRTTGLVGLMRDATAQVERQQALSEKMDRCVAYSEMTGDLIFTMDLGGKFESVDGAARELELAPEDLIGHDLRSLVLPGDRPLVDDALERLRHGQAVPSTTCRWSGGGGRERAMEVRWRLRRDQRGQPHAVVGSARDVTDRLRTESELRERLATERLLADVAEMLLTVETDGFDAAVSRALGRIADFLGADRAALLSIGKGAVFTRTHHWATGGGDLFAAAVTADSIPWVLGSFVNQEPIWASPIAALPLEGQAELQSIGLASGDHFVMQPVILENRAVGATVLARKGGASAWGDAARGLFGIFTGILAVALARRTSESRMREHGIWETAASRVAAAVLEAKGGEQAVTAALESGLQVLVETADARAAALYRLSGGSFSLVASWSNEHVERGWTPSMATGARDRLNRVFAEQDMFCQPDTTEFDAEERRAFADLVVPGIPAGVVAMLIKAGENLAGVLVVAGQEDRGCPQGTVDGLRLAGQALTASWARRLVSASLAHRLEIEALVGRSVAELAGVTEASLTETLRGTMDGMARILGASQAAFYVPSGERRLKDIVHDDGEDTAGGWSLSRLPADSSLLRQLIAGQALVYSPEHELPEEHRQALLQAGVADDYALQCLPVMEADKLLAVFCLYGQTAGLHVSVEDQVPLNTLASAVLGAVERVKAERGMKNLAWIRSKFIQVVSHQLRTPLNSIRWSLEALLSGELGPMSGQQVDFLRIVYESEMKIITRIHDMITAMDIEEGRISLARERVDLAMLLTGVLGQLRARVENQQLKLQYQAPERPLPQVSADAEKVRFTLDALLRNAIFYTPPGGTVKVWFESDDGSVRFVVEDTGIGIPAVEQGRIYERFMRGSNASVMVQDASGLGLSIAKYYVERHGGTIGFLSEKGKGSKFWFSLPVDRPR
jgi:PAS domain S-box-containing protein